MRLFETVEEGEQEKNGSGGRKVDLAWNSIYSRIADRTPYCGLSQIADKTVCGFGLLIGFDIYEYTYIYILE